jgi:hypothetical protein
MFDSNVASPKKLAKPLTSVIVVRMMEDAVAGSRLSAVKMMGTAACTKSAAISVSRPSFVHAAQRARGGVHAHAHQHLGSASSIQR